MLLLTPFASRVSEIRQIAGRLGSPFKRDKCRYKSPSSIVIQNRVDCNLVPRAFSSKIFKMADRRDKTLAKAGSRGTKSPKILEIFITWHFEKGQNKMAAKHRVGSKNAVTLYTRQWWLRSTIKYHFNRCFDSGAGLFSICKFIPLSYSLYF